MPRFAVSMFCQRVEGPDVESGHPAGVTSVVHEPGVVAADSTERAAEIGRAILRKVYPPEDGWTGHHARVVDAGMVLTVENAQPRRDD